MRMGRREGGRGVLGVNTKFRQTLVKRLKVMARIRFTRLNRGIDLVRQLTFSTRLKTNRFVTQKGGNLG